MPLSILECKGVGKFPAFSGQKFGLNNPTMTGWENIGPIPKGRYYILNRQSGGLMLNLIVPKFISVDLQYRIADIAGVAGAEQIGNMLVNITFIISLILAVIIFAVAVTLTRSRKS